MSHYYRDMHFSDQHQDLYITDLGNGQQVISTSMDPDGSGFIGMFIIAIAAAVGVYQWATEPPEPDPGPRIVSLPKYDHKKWTSSGVCNIRKEPGKRHAVSGKTIAGETYRYHDAAYQGGRVWYKIDYRGWVGCKNRYAKGLPRMAG